jgi:hypothetical protein
MKYHYYFSHTFAKGSNTGFGSFCFISETLIDSNERIEGVKQHIVDKEGYDGCIIISFQLLRTENIGTTEPHNEVEAVKES